MCIPMKNRIGIRKLRDLLETLADPDHCLFSLGDLSQAFPELSPEALKMLVSRSTNDGLLVRVCRGIYLYERASKLDGRMLHRTATRLRAGTFCYISLESALSDAGVISQLPLQWLTVMGGGRSATIECGRWGTIEFIHTAKSSEQLAHRLVYDDRYGMWRAPVSLAMQDMKDCKRPLDLVDWSMVDELI